VTFDGRIDRATLADDEDLPTLILTRLLWDGGDEEALARGPRAVLLLSAATNEIYNGGTLQLVHNRGQDLGFMHDAAAMVRARPYKRFFRDLMRDALKNIQIPVELEDWAELAGQDIVAAYDDRFYALEGKHGSPLDYALRYVHAHPGEFFLSETEVAADEDDFVRRLAARVGPLPGATDDDLAQLPPLLRRLYREVGASGWGPAGGFRAPAEVAAARTDTLLPIVDGFVADARTPALEVSPFEAERGIVFGPGGAATLRDWLECWMRGLYPFES
jgi:hypothetical protein